MPNVIVNRVQEFLKRYPPFSFLDEEAAHEVATSIEVRYHSKGEHVFFKGDPAQQVFFVLRQGQVHLLEREQSSAKVAEVCDEGDVFGVLALLGKRPYILDALVVEDSLIYAIPVDVFEKILHQNSRVSLFFAAGFASGQLVVRKDLSQAQKARTVFQKGSTDNGLMIFSGIADWKFTSEVLTCQKETTAQDAAQLMAERSVGSIIIVDENQHPLGIVTDKDLRSKLVAKGMPHATPVENLMSTPVLTKSKDARFPDLYLSMIKNRLHHLVITQDGTAHSPVSGILSDHDILLSQGNSPAVLIHALMNTWDIQEMAKIRDKAEKLLKYYLENEVSMDFLSAVVTEINDTIIQRAIQLAIDKHLPDFPEFDKLKFCFLSLGSEGREEQLLRTDLDNAIVYEDVDETESDRAHAFIQLIGQEVIESLLICGFKACPADIMASNPVWCQPLQVWKNHFSDWILKPNQQALLNATIVFDFRPVYGEKALANRLTEHIYQSLESRNIFLNYLAKNALTNPPPLGFFKNFIVEKSGEQKDRFDIKLRAMMPLTDIARLLSLSHRIVGVNNTFERFEKLAELETNYPDLMREAGKAYEILMRARAIEGLHTQTDGRFIDPASLGKLQRQLLKNAFSPIDELQKILQVRFQTDYFKG